jgi:two-component system cell cycle sensor histidine kinase/response regulator CckA
MTDQDDRSERTADLRRRAEAADPGLAVRSLNDLEDLSPDEARAMLHELRVHKAELEMQNDELLRAQAESEAARKRYFDLYNGAPVGYCTLSETGVILEANLTAAALLQVAQSTLIKQAMSRFILNEDQDIDYLHRRRLCGTGEPQVYELRMVRMDGTVFWARVEATAAQDDDGASVCRVAMSGITERKQAEDALQESEEMHRALVAALPDVVMRFDRDGRHLFVSDNVSEVIDLQAAQFIGRTHRDLGFPEAQCRFWEEAIRGVFDSGAPLETEFTFEGKRGPVRHNWRLVPERDEQGVVQTLLSVSRDVTDQRRAEQDYQTLFREMLDGFAVHEIICDGQGNPIDYRFLAVNPAFERMTGLRAQDIVGRTVRDVLPGIERHWIETYGKVALTGEPVFLENHSADLQKHFHVTAFRPGPNQFACIIADITDRKRIEEALRESRVILQAILDSITVRVFWKDKDLVYLGCNAPFAQDAGLEKPEDLIGRDDRALAWREQAELYRADDRAVIESGEARLLFEELQTTPSGEQLHLLTSKLPLRDAGGAIVGVLGTYQDISGRKRAEEERALLQAQLNQAQKMEFVGRLAGGVAHDFNNMLGVILGRVEMALDRVGPAEPLHGDLQEIRQAAERSADLTRQLLAFARKQTVIPKVLDLNETVEGMLKMLRRLIGEDIDLVWAPGKNLWQVRVDPSQIDQILANLFVNARDAITGVGKVTIETDNVAFDEAYCGAHRGFVPGEFVQLVVSDSGCGMDRDTLPHIFEPFFTTKGLARGTGLGLATVYGIVKQNNGFIKVYSEPGLGTTFKIYLPRHASKAEQVGGDGPATPAARGNETILLVEDEPAILSMTTIMLERFGYRVLTAATPGEAIHLAREHAGEIHMLMTDVIMPEMNGRDLARNVVSLYPDLKRLFMSGYTADIIAHHGVLEEGIYFIQKPFSAQQLAARVREALDSESGKVF